MFKKIKPEEFECKPVELIDKEWMLIAAGDKNKYNMMTASWGGFGVLWHKPVATVYIRPRRYTDSFVRESKYFSLSFLGDNKEPHKICGSKSGRDIDKMHINGLTPVFDNNGIYFEEARLVIVCRKIYHSKLFRENFLDPDIENLYADKSYHNVYVGEIEIILVKE